MGGLIVSSMVTLPLIYYRLYHMGQSFLPTARKDCSAVKTITTGLCLLENHPASTSVVNCLFDYQKDTARFFCAIMESGKK